MAPFKQVRIPAHLNPTERVKKVSGRPSHYKPEYCDLVIERMGEGLSLTGFAGSIGESRDAVYDWIRAHADFSIAVSRARSARVKWWEEKLKSSRKGAETSASIFALRNADPVEWRDVRTTEHNHNLTITTLNDAQLNAIAAGMSPAEIGSLATIDVTPSRLGTELGTGAAVGAKNVDKSKT